MIPYDCRKTEKDDAVYNIHYCGETKQLSPEHLTAALFTKLKDITETELGVKVNLSDMERRALQDRFPIQ